ncbi:hypothetical protein HELRODRAFT_156183 [Helobdella robusta]|uniref:1-phosphatidylinositol-5-phosphate 4-kinase n=1 Tax=Helobdella robusta TaxID=6412 RepID=T1ELS3_HELRO|nr:hypothetical protein HELRODRAFT_156183 [Helobdella robusta]ESN90596.1 hypothetical protein HELRODRAFT_156183 [Helobdella robusta]
MSSIQSVSTKQKKKRIKAVHQKLRVFRAKEPLLGIIMWGVNHSRINELSLVNPPVMLMPDDFKAYSKIRIDNHLFNKENMPSHFKFKEWCPLVFRNLRERFSVDEDCYMNSLVKHCPTDIDSPGKSGARFLISHDRKYILKTITTEDVAEMIRILKDYHQYVVEHHAETRLPHILGMYKICINDTDTHHVMVMKNVFSAGFNIHRKYDLKGSTVARQASEKERAKELPTLKDNDFLSEKTSIHIHKDDKAKLIKILEADSTFLASLNLMDYSLLVGIHEVNHPSNFVDEDDEEEDDEDLEQEDENNANDSSMFTTPPSSPRIRTESDGDYVYEYEPDQNDPGYFAIKSNDKSPQPVIYFMSLIDILTRYGVKKKTAKAAKTMKHGAGAEISTVKPDQYAKRFMEFIDRIIVVD